MKIFRFKYKKKVKYGVLEEEYLLPVKGSIFGKIKTEKERIPISDVILLPPVEPSKIVAVGANYKDHAMEMGKPLPAEPLLFMKPSTSVIGPNDIIVYPKNVQKSRL